ncbi:hypothetical protein D3C80_2127830 [compost metagenome]
MLFRKLQNNRTPFVPKNRPPLLHADLTQDDSFVVLSRRQLFIAQLPYSEPSLEAL